MPERGLNEVYRPSAFLPVRRLLFSSAMREACRGRNSLLLSLVSSSGKLEDAKIIAGLFYCPFQWVSVCFPLVGGTGCGSLKGKPPLRGLFTVPLGRVSVDNLRCGVGWR